MLVWSLELEHDGDIFVDFSCVPFCGTSYLSNVMGPNCPCYQNKIVGISSIRLKVNVSWIEYS